MAAWCAGACRRRPAQARAVPIPSDRADDIAGESCLMATDGADSGPGGYRRHGGVDKVEAVAGRPAEAPSDHLTLKQGGVGGRGGTCPPCDAASSPGQRAACGVRAFTCCAMTVLASLGRVES